MSSPKRLRENARASTLVLRAAIAASILLLAGASSAGATVITFEPPEFFSFDGMPVGAVSVPGNTVIFSVRDPAMGTTGPAYIAWRGEPETAFEGDDLAPSRTFLTDEYNPLGGPSISLEYRIQFETAVSDLALDLYDYRGDGGGQIGQTATLRVYSDLFTTVVGIATYTVPFPQPPEGNVVNLAVLFPDAPILSASLEYGRDRGTGIDNVAFDVGALGSTVVPEPGTWLLVGAGGGALPLLRRRFRRRRGQ